MSEYQAFSTNINDTVKVKLTPKGYLFLRAQHEKRNELFRQRIGSSAVTAFNLATDEDGYTKFQLWELMQTFGPHMGLGLDNMIETTIIISKGIPINKGADS